MHDDGAANHLFVAFEDLQQLGRFMLRDEGKSIAIRRVVALGRCWEL